MPLLLFHFAMTCFMTGVIWIVQVVHYPLFANVGVLGYPEYQRLHMRKITWVVLPAMLLEAVSAGLLCMPELVGLERVFLEENMRILLWANVLLLGVIWASTAFLQVPLHSKLSQNFGRGVHARLVRSNWIRTIVWSVRLGLVFYLAMTATCSFD